MCNLPRPCKHTATHCSTLQHTAIHCNTLQHTATQCNTLAYPSRYAIFLVPANTLQHVQHAATYCNTMQHTSIPVSICNLLCYAIRIESCVCTRANAASAHMHDATHVCCVVARILKSLQRKKKEIIQKSAVGQFLCSFSIIVIFISPFTLPPAHARMARQT